MLLLSALRRGSLGLRRRRHGRGLLEGAVGGTLLLSLLRLLRLRLRLLLHHGRPLWATRGADDGTVGGGRCDAVDVGRASWVWTLGRRAISENWLSRWWSTVEDAVDGWASCRHVSADGAISRKSVCGCLRWMA